MHTIPNTNVTECYYHKYESFPAAFIIICYIVYSPLAVHPLLVETDLRLLAALLLPLNFALEPSHEIGRVL